ncbi:hypothetical protein UM654_08220 [Staphylococcus aureus]|nr:hypothetical protein UM654_08220 [Staphylococcus aureus]
MAKYNEYSQLLDATYSQAVAYLLSKYGAVTDDYYKEKSYTRFLNGEIKSISKGKYTRASEGLYCHHISEDKFQNLSDLRFISKFKYSYDIQKKENLVYCDLIEHLILHAIITKESHGQFGVAGLCQMIKPTVIDWYIGEYNPKPAWMQATKARAYLPGILVEKSLIKIDDMLKGIEI